ncbi:MAG: hypothetical protein OXE77_05035 [Flavobacteriaceae bacterium]|nr:hypothetical protein [Flavobacteriaceae bacterium]
MGIFEAQKKRCHEKTIAWILAQERYSRTPAFHGGCDDPIGDQNITKNKQTKAE